MTVKEDQLLLFVYGTLKGTMPLTSIIEESDSITGLAYDLGSFPAVVAVGTGDKVMGQVISINTRQLAMFDKYEGYPDLYGRVHVTTAAGHPCQVYVLNNRIDDWSNDGPQTHIPIFNR